ncbi:MAG: hypothetical protein JSV17_02040 [Candidatus Aminicenantes bacterium]|nr:MAG: hypothetical protein JSV17_02040 [Candidatus Aminicenantes bacterium]
MISESLLHFVEFELQIIALTIFAILYALKIVQLVKLPMPREVAPASGNPAKGVAFSFSTLINPFSMDSTTKHLWRWMEFLIYHLGALSAILATFTLPFAPKMMAYPVRIVFAIFIGLGAIVGISKIIRRLANPHLRYVSVPDDYFSLIAVEIYFIAAAGCLVYFTDGWRFVFFLITALFLVYVPFSKISHYVFWFFARIYLGIRFGRRGILPKKRLQHG